MNNVFRHFICLLESIIFFSIGIFLKRSYDVVFYYPAHFNRGLNGENEFFEPFYEICIKNNISYLIFEEPDFSENSIRNKKTVPFDFVFYLLIILRKFVPVKKFESFEHREWYFANILNRIYFKNIYFSNYIVLSNSMLGFFRGLNKNAHLYDYQHGVITSTPRSYSDKLSTPKNIRLNNSNVLVYGKGFSNLLKKSVTDNYYHSHSKIIGHYLKADMVDNYDNRKILFSLQIAEPNIDFNNKKIDLIVEFFRTYSSFFIKNKIEILLKHHPRFQNEVDPSPLYEFDFTSLYDEDIIKGLKKSFLHITLHSTTTFEAASLGIPTLLLNNNLLNPIFFVDDYSYPLGIKSGENIYDSIKYYLKDKNKYLKDSKLVFDWYQNYYSELNQELFIELMKCPDGRQN